jgi:hypothetical protein
MRTASAEHTQATVPNSRKHINQDTFTVHPRGWALILKRKNDRFYTMSRHNFVN